MDEQVSEKDRADQAFGLITRAIDAAISGTFPTGLNAVEQHMQIKGALQFLSDVLKEHYGEEAPDLSVSKPVIEPELVVPESEDK